ncbi:MAG TPA: 2-oxoglutarate dehydrogenase complex dihydrolipoyllysine-residue succinyltransferase [Methylocella sp.]|nr:2-oxoglutarate dehydrogenase complex dihydrolipoyllysine-residue succinyltransferase [Methylocella sp.]
MTVEIRVPPLGESISEATVGKWFKKAGEPVVADEPIVELETEKVTLEANAPASGVLAEIIAKDGETVKPGALLGRIGEGPAAGEAKGEGKAPAPKPAEPPPSAPERSPRETVPAYEMPASPAAAKIAADRGVDTGALEGSGKRGQVLKGDILDFLAKAPVVPPIPAPPPPPPARREPLALEEAQREERVPMTRLRQTIARRLKDAQNTAAMLTTFNEADMSAVMSLRAKYKDGFEKQHGAKLGFMGFFVKACVGALKEVPSVNAEIDGADVVYKNYYHLGVAVGTDKGLVVPVVRDCDELSIGAIEKTIADLGQRARAGQLKIEEMQGGTFTITNGGIYGSLMSTPILNAPQSGILGMHKIQERPIAVNGKIEIRPMMYLALTYDHRLVDGKEAVTFLVRVKEALEDPARLVLEI